MSDRVDYDLDKREYLAEFLSISPPTAPVKDEDDSRAISIAEADLSEDEEASLYYPVGYCIRSLKWMKQLGCD